VQRVDKVFEDSLTQISALITPEQKVKLDKLVQERREMMMQRPGHMRDGRRRGPDGPP
jgi:Spy/CpxP family protein refolding chaperone